MTTHLYLVRHGETQWNKKGILQGHLDSPLTAESIVQAEKLAEIFQNKNLDIILASDLYRAQHTAEIIAKKIGLSVKTSPLLRERNFGKSNGMSVTAFKKKFSQQYKERDLLANDEEKAEFKFADDIENDVEVMDRFMKGLKKLVINDKKISNALVVSHGGVMRRLLTKIGWCNYAQIPPDAIANLGYYLLETDGKSFKVLETAGVARI